MIATRFRSVGWVVAGTTAMLGCYLITQRVAGERAQLAKVERTLLNTKREARRLHTEIETRSRMSQIERWNSDVLALSAPRASQYITGEIELASFNQPQVPAAITDQPALPAGVAQASFDAQAVDQVEAPAAPRIVPASYLKPKDAQIGARVQRIALLDEQFEHGNGQGKKSAQ